MSCLRAVGSMFCAIAVRDNASEVGDVAPVVLVGGCMVGACVVCWDASRPAR